MPGVMIQKDEIIIAGTKENESSIDTTLKESG